MIDGFTIIMKGVLSFIMQELLQDLLYGSPRYSNIFYQLRVSLRYI